MSQIILLVTELLSVCSTGESIYFEMFLCKNNCLANFNCLGPKLMSGLNFEVELLLIQLRLFQ